MDQNLLRGYEDSLYRHDAEYHIAGRLGALPGRVLRTRRNTLQRPHEFAREYFRQAGFEHVAYMVEWNHDWALASALVERWRPESHTFHLPCGEMTMTLEDVAYQLGLATEGEPVSGCMTGWETFYEGRTMEDLCQQLLGAVPGENDRQAAGKWVVNMTWFRDRVCQGVGEDATEERLMQYTRGYIMQIIGGMLFPDVSDSRVHMRWLPLLEDLDRCGQLSWGSAVLAVRHNAQHSRGG